jgi:23S rRNA (uracil1939-C5)-methyltransferase
MPFSIRVKLYLAMTHARAKQPAAPPVMLRLKLDSMTPEGDCVAYHEGGRIVVAYGISGEEVLAEVQTRRDGSRVGHVKEVLSASAHRVKPRCVYYGECGGCQLQHVDYEEQLHFKREKVVSHFLRFGLPTDVVKQAAGCAEPWAYRNHARFTVRHGILGFTNRFTHRFVQIDRCELMAPWINQTLQKLQGKCSETTQLAVRYGSNTDSWLIQPAMKSQDLPLDTGQPEYEEALLGKRFHIGSPSFFQVNTAQAERMVGLVKESLKLTGRETLVDAYAGVGTFAVLLAPYAARVIAIEESSSAVANAKQNIEGLQNIEIIETKTEDALAQLIIRPDAIIVDPPRVGCFKSAIDSLVRLAAQRLVYISCDPESLAGDLSMLIRGGYKLTGVQPIDLFPHTHHIECLASLEWEG